nr:hypothetical protein [uncultured Novosphingobium sp.]
MIAAMAHMNPSRQHYDCCPFQAPIGNVRKSATRPEFGIVGQLLEKSPAFDRVRNDRVWPQATAISLILETCGRYIKLVQEAPLDWPPTTAKQWL